MNSLQKQQELGRHPVEVTINAATEHRRLLLDAMVNVTAGKMNVGQANAVAALSGEVHKSIRLEWDVLCYAAEKLT